MHYLKHLFVGMLLGLFLVKSEAVSWFRIQEMFRFQSFHMYGIIISAIIVGAISIQILKRANIQSINGELISVSRKEMKPYRYIIGGTIFGLGWALTGACPGPLYALVGHGFMVILVVLLSAFIGTWVYGLLQPKLPH